MIKDISKSFFVRYKLVLANLSGFFSLLFNSKSKIIQRILIVLIKENHQCEWEANSWEQTTKEFCSQFHISTLFVARQLIISTEEMHFLWLCQDLPSVNHNPVKQDDKPKRDASANLSYTLLNVKIVAFFINVHILFSQD